MTLNRQSVLLILMALFVLAGGFYYFFTVPLKKEAETLQQNLQQEESFLQALRRASTQKTETEAARFPPGYQQKIPEAPYLDQIMLDMTRVETVSGVSMEGVGLSNSEDKDGANGSTKGASAQNTVSFTPLSEGTNGNKQEYPGLETVSISTKITGTYEQVYRFFREVLSLPRAIRVEQVKMNGVGGNFIYFHPQDDKYRQITAELTLTAYYAPVLKPYFPNPLPIIAPQPANRTNPFY